MERVELRDGTVFYRVTADDFNDEQRAALRRHGYRDDIPPAGVGGGPDRIYGGRTSGPLRARICFLDGIEIDGHESSDLDTDLTCIHCGANDPYAETTEAWADNPRDLADPGAEEWEEMGAEEAARDRASYAFHRGEVEQTTPYPAGLAAIESGSIDWEADDIKVLLVTNEYWPTPQHRYYSDIAHEAAGIGYPQGGIPVTRRFVWMRDDGTRALDCVDIGSPVMTLIARSVVFYKDTGDPSTSPLILCMRFDEDQKLVYGVFTLEVPSEGLLTLPTAEPTDTEGGAE